MKALLSSLMDQLDDVLAHLRLAIPPQEWMYPPDPYLHGRDIPPPDAMPKEFHQSLVDIYDPTNSWRTRPIGHRWWPELDELCVMRERLRQYYRDL